MGGGPFGLVLDGGALPFFGGGGGDALPFFGGGGGGGVSFAFFGGGAVVPCPSSEAVEAGVCPSPSSAGGAVVPCPSSEAVEAGVCPSPSSAEGVVVPSSSSNGLPIHSPRLRPPLLFSHRFRGVEGVCPAWQSSP